MAPLVKKYCAGCHNPGTRSGGIVLTAFANEAAVLKGRNVWEKVSHNLESRHMPPPRASKPTDAERAKLVAWIDTFLSTAQCVIEDPGRVTMRRLNREEYNNTIRDLVGVKFRPADDFPSDDVGYGFDNIGDVLSISPLLMEKYLSAAEKVAALAIVVPAYSGASSRIDLAKLEGGLAAEIGRIQNTNGEVFVQHDFPTDGDYIVRTTCFGRQVGPEPVKMALRLDDKELTQAVVAGDRRNPSLIQSKTKLKAGAHKVSVAFLNEFHRENDLNPVTRDRVLTVAGLEIIGPMTLKNQALPESHSRIIFVKPVGANQAECARKIMSEFARRAYRRPVTADEVERLVRIVDLALKNGDTFERGIQLGVQAALVSPNFLFRVETDPYPNNPKASHFVNDYELASRLSYFLWSSMPDDELFLLAKNGVLHDKKVLEMQSRRMLRDPRAHSLVDNFADQWLTLRNIANVNPNPSQFPAFNNELRAAMRKETELFFENLLKQDRSVLEFVDANYTFLNEPLAKHYGISGVQGDEFRRVSLAGTQRGGLITQASILTITSNPTRTSPVKRGKWILEQMMGTPPPPPPPGVPDIDDEKNVPLKGTLRQRMEQHRKNPMCASCHAQLDPLGFGLENFDAIGAWRTKEGDLPIDSSGILPDGRKFRGPGELKQILLGKKDLIVRNLTEKMLTYALGRGMEEYDKCACRDIAKVTANNNYRFTSIITEIAKSDPFRKRRGDKPIQKAQN